MEVGNRDYGQVLILVLSRSKLKIKIRKKFAEQTVLIVLDFQCQWPESLYDGVLAIVHASIRLKATIYSLQNMNECNIYFSIAADFGLSKIIGAEVTTNTVCGTPGYCGRYCVVYIKMSYNVFGQCSNQ